MSELQSALRLVLQLAPTSELRWELQSVLT
jgi:hypothetical protein